MIVADLNRRLPERYAAGPRIQLGSVYEVVPGPHDRYRDELRTSDATDSGGGVATAVLAPPQPTLAVATDMPDPDVYEVFIEDREDSGRIVAAIEIVSPANKDRPETRRAFVAKCGSLLLDHVCVTIVDLVTVRRANLQADLLDFFEVSDPSMGPEPPGIYAATSRWRKRRPGGFLETWAHPMELGRALPMLPVWLNEDTWVPPDLESSYEETCRNLRLA